MLSLGAAFLCLAPAGAGAQERGAAALGQAVQGLGVNTRVLMIGAHPDDEDTYLITWLQRGRHVETAYLSLTRGDGGQNVIGNELGEALGVVRTEELLAARRVDGAGQYFTRAFDFGFSKDTIDTFGHWRRDSVLGDVVRAVRAFRPHVIVSVFSGTTRDGHGHHQVAGILAREAYDAAADARRFPESAFGARWTPLKFYRAARFNADAGTLAMDVGEYSPLLGRSYGEIAGESRSQHKSQAFGSLQRKGPLVNHVRREATRVNEHTPPPSERSLFDGIDTTWRRLHPDARVARERAALDSLPAALAAARAAFDAFHPERLTAPLERVSALLDAVCPTPGGSPCMLGPDLTASVRVARQRAWHARALAAGVAIEAAAPRELFPVGDSVPVTSTIYNRGRDTVWITRAVASGVTATPSGRRAVPPGGVLRDTLAATLDVLSQPWWLAGGRAGGMFTLSHGHQADSDRAAPLDVTYLADHGRTESAFPVREAVVFRFADEVKGEVRRAASGVPRVAVSLDGEVQYARANAPVDRALDVHLTSADASPRDVRVSLTLPRGLTADSAARTVRLDRFGAQRTVTFRVRGRLAPGAHRVAATAETDGERFDAGYRSVDYDHIRPQRLYRPAAVRLSAVDVTVPAGLRVLYVTGVSDNVAPALSQLGVAVTVVAPGALARVDLAPFTTVVVGPRAYDANPELVAANPRLLDFVRRGGTMVVQYGQYEMTRPGMTPYPLTMNRPHDRVTHEHAPVTILDRAAPELSTPNRITDADFAGWVQERALYMPRTFDERYRPLLAMGDPGAEPNRGAVLVAPYGRGIYVYTSLAFFRQLPAGVPGAARLFVNLLSTTSSPPEPP